MGKIRLLDLKVKRCFLCIICLFLFCCLVLWGMISAVYKRTTMPVFKAHGISMARISDCASETFSSIRTVRIWRSWREELWWFWSASENDEREERLRVCNVWIELQFGSVFVGFHVSWWSLVNDDLRFSSAVLEQVRSFGGERRQTSMFEKQVLALKHLLGVKEFWANEAVPR